MNKNFVDLSASDVPGFEPQSVVCEESAYAVLKNIPQNARANYPISLILETSIINSELSVNLVSPDGKVIPLMRPAPNSPTKPGDPTSPRTADAKRLLEISFTPKFAGKMGIQVLQKKDIVQSGTIVVHSVYARYARVRENR